MNDRPGFISDTDDMLHDMERMDASTVGVVTNLNRPTLLRLHNVHGCSVEWIAKQLKLPVEAVASEIERHGSRLDQ